MKQRHRICSLMREMKPGESFYMEATAKLATNYANRFGVKITTQVCLVVENISTVPVAKRVTKVTVVEPNS